MSAFLKCAKRTVTTTDTRIVEFTPEELQELALAASELRDDVAFAWDVGLHSVRGLTLRCVYTTTEEVPLTPNK